MSAEQEIETQRHDAVKAAMTIKRSLAAEKSGLKKKLKNVKDREKAMYAALERAGVSQGPFDEAFKRAGQDEQELNLFDTEASEVEDWIRDWIEDDKNKPAQSTADSAPEYTEEEKADMAAAAEEGSEDLAEDADDPEADGQADIESAIAGEHADTEITDKAEEDQAVEETEVAIQAPPPDDNFKARTRQVHPEAGAEGVSMDQIPMPGDSQIHNLAAEQQKRQPRKRGGFVDHRETLTTDEYRAEMAKTGQG
jgi:hypothetical protein